MIAARTTGAQSQTKREKISTKLATDMIRKVGGRNQKRKVTNKIHSVILKPLTAMKCVNQELLKSSWRSRGIFSRAHNKIPPKNIASCSGNIVDTLRRKEERNDESWYKTPCLLSSNVSIILLDVEKYIPRESIYFLYQNPSKSSSGYTLPS